MEKSKKSAASVALQNENSLEALRAKTERLKALRLARDAATPAVAPKRKAAGKSRAKRPAGKLSDWLNERANEGRRS